MIGSVHRAYIIPEPNQTKLYWQRGVYFLPKFDFIITLPIFRSRPAFDVGIPVCRANCCLACVMPRALFHENDNPGIFIIGGRIDGAPGLPRCAIGISVLFFEQSVDFPNPHDEG